MHFRAIASGLASAACLTSIIAAPSGRDFLTVRRSDGTIAGRDNPDMEVPDDIISEVEAILPGINGGSRKRDNTLSERSALVKRIESQYLGFDSNDATDQGHLQQLNDGWKNAIELTSYLERSWDNVVDSGTYGHYFADADQDKVKQVYQNVWGSDDNEGSVDLGYIFWVKSDFGKACTASGSEQAGQDITLAYIANKEVSGSNAGIGHVCDQAYEKPKINDVSCDDLGDTVSPKMDVLGAILLHEYTHFDNIGLAGAGFHVTDNAYGPLDVRNICDNCKLLNADSYRWLALEYFWTTICGKQFSGPREQDNADDTCNPGRCVVQ